MRSTHHRPATWKVAAMAASAALVLAACGGDDGAPAVEGENGDWPSQEEVIAEIDAVIERFEAGELSYDATADTDEVIEALREVIPQPDGYPTRSIEYIVPWGEGGGSDNYARHIGHDGERILGQTIVYNNMPGGGGEVGQGHLFTQAPDGYTIYGAIANQSISDALDTQPWSFSQDSSFIIRNQGATEIYWVRDDSEFDSFEDMLGYAASNPGQIRVGGAGVGSDDEFRLLALEAELDTQFVYVPFDAVGERTSALLGGDIDLLHETAGTIIDLYHDGQIRPLAYGGDIVFDDIDPDIPSVADLGYQVPIGRWRGMTTLAEVDQQIIDYLHNVFYAASRLPFYTEYEEEFMQHIAGGYLNSAQFEQAVVEEVETVRQLAEELGYELEEE
jgi:putative tricarboxylic transport membrane protein